MNQEELLTGTRWEILKALSKKNMTSTEISKEIKTTLPNISQNIRLLEAYNYVSRGKIKNNKGKPCNIYELKKEISNLMICSPGNTNKIQFNPNLFQKSIINTFFLKKEQKWIIQLLLNQEFIDMCESVAYINSNDKEIHLLTIVKEIDKFRKEYSHVNLENNKEKKKIACWSHTKEEAIEGLKRKEKYYLDMFKKPSVIIDEKNILSQIKDEGGIE